MVRSRDLWARLAAAAVPVVIVEMHPRSAALPLVGSCAPAVNIAGRAKCCPRDSPIARARTQQEQFASRLGLGAPQLQHPKTAGTDGVGALVPEVHNSSDG